MNIEPFSEDLRSKIKDELKKNLNKEFPDEIINVIESSSLMVALFVESEQFNALNEVEKEKSQIIIGDLIASIFVSNIEQNNFYIKLIETFNDVLLALKRDETRDYFISIAPVLTAFFNFIFYKELITEDELKGILETINKYKPSFEATFDEISNLEDTLSEDLFEEDEEYDEEHEEFLDSLDEMYLEFKDSEHYENLSPEHKGLSEDIIFNFADIIFSEMDEEPDSWEPESVALCMLNEIPEVAPVTETWLRALKDVISAYICFLSDLTAITNKDELLKEVELNEAEMIKRALDKDNWDENKSILMEAIEQGVDIDDSEQLGKFIESMLEKADQMGILSSVFADEEDDVIEANDVPYIRENVKIGRNEPCFCGSGKKYKKCCGNISKN